MMKVSRITQEFAIKGITMFFLTGIVFFGPTVIHAASEIQATGIELTSRVAPGEFLPLSVKLLNIGNKNRVDVALTYNILDSRGNVLYSSQETVAVETTASFVKAIPIPASALPGPYKAESFIRYPGQVTAATSEFAFTVENKIFGFFQSDFYFYGGIILFIGILLGMVSRFWMRRRRTTRLGPIDYSDVPGETRVFYELISDTVMEMRQEVGEKAVDIVSQIKGITIDGKTGRVLTLTGKPSKIIAELVSEYEKVLGKKVSFSFRRPNNKTH